MYAAAASGCSEPVAIDSPRDHEQALALAEIGDRAVVAGSAEPGREVPLVCPILQRGGGLHVLGRVERQLIALGPEDQAGEVVGGRELILDDRVFVDPGERVAVRELDGDLSRLLRGFEILLELREGRRELEPEVREHLLVVVDADDLTHRGVPVEVAGAEVLPVG
jgi:hypothetical protein